MGYMSGKEHSGRDIS